MPTGSDFQDGLNAASVDQAALRAALQNRTAYYIGTAEDPTDFVAVDPDTGALVKVVLFNGGVFWYDAADTTTAHDGVSTVVSNDGKRYKREAVFNFATALDKDLTTPPGSPTIGNRYLINAASSGAWSGHTKSIAVYTARGWEFEAPTKGKILYLEDESAFYHYTAAGAWAAGFGSTSIPSLSVVPASVLGGRVAWVVENQTTNAPPGTPTDGVQYIVGGSPTGAWAGHAGKLALAQSSAWIITTPVEGWQAYDKALNKLYFYTGAAWATLPAGWSLIESQTPGSDVASVDFTAGLNDTYDRYVFQIINARPSVDAASAFLRVGTGAGPTFETTGHQWARYSLAVGGAVTAASGAGFPNDAAIVIASSIGNAAAECMSAEVFFDNPEGATFPVMFRSRSVHLNGSGEIVVSDAAGSHIGPVTGLRFMFSTGNVKAGAIFRLFGVAK